MKGLGVGLLAISLIALALPPDTARALQTASGAWGNADPQWAPDGARIAYVSQQGRTEQIYVMNADGSSQTPLTSSGENHSQRWSPDGRQIVFVSGRSQPTTEIRVMNADGSEQKRLTFGRRDLDPAWSPDGRRIAFRSVEPWHIYVMNSDGSDVRQIAATAPTKSVGWSPDGQWITFVSVTNRRPQIYLVRPDGRDLRELASPGDSPSWSPDSQRIAFDSGFPGPNIYVTDTSGGSPMQLTTSTAASLANRAPSWSPDGRRIIFQSLHEGWHVSVMNANGSAQTQFPGFPLNSNISDPIWAPDSQRIALSAFVCQAFQSGTVSYGSCLPQIFVMNVDGSGLKQLTGL